jgi:starch synthase (maltosyl-transferring)
MRHGSPSAPTPTADGRRRVVVQGVSPQIDGGRFPIKRVVGDVVSIEADAFTDGHDLIRVRLRHKSPSATAWAESEMESLGNDRWRGSFAVDELGRHAYSVVAWVDPWATWTRDLRKRVDADQDVGLDLKIGAELVAMAAKDAEGGAAARLVTLAAALGRGRMARRITRALSPELHELMLANPIRRWEAVSAPVLEVDVEPRDARFSSWYEIFPRSASSEAGRTGTLGDVIDRLEYVAALGFDVLYLPPIHPIGWTFRKGPNNAPRARKGDPGVPWAIGSHEGGHDAVHPDLGTFADVRKLVEAAAGHGIEIALDLAFQASPDHPYVHDHPEWFRRRPDGTIQYAENPPKKYQDIYPFDFESADWQALWEELLGIVRAWIEQGIRIFRVDNPHTKPFAFWEWLIAEVKRDRPDVIFLAEAFTRPKVMYRLAKLGFSQSYTYFTWRNTRRELIDYFTELTRPPISDFFRPNAWPNTPDILPEYLQIGGRPAFAARAVLAATLSAAWGVYGPAFELLEAMPREPGSEEYLDSEKYQRRHWDLDRPDSLAPLLARLNEIRRTQPALQSNERLTFHDTENEKLIAYSKRTQDGRNLVITVVNLDPHHVQTGWLELPLEELGIHPERPYEVRDLLDDTAYLWQGPRNYVELHPARLNAHVLLLAPRIRTEEEFEYYL